MLSGSALHVPLPKSTRRTLRAQDMSVSSIVAGGRLRVELLRPLAHLPESRPVRVDISDGTGGACLRAGGVAAAQVALLHLARVLHIVHRAERAGDRADLAADAYVVEHDLRAGGCIDLDRLHRARMQAPRLVALRAGVGHLASSVVEVEHLDARLRRVEDLIVLVRAGHLALQTTGALRRVDVKRLLHDPLPDRALERADPYYAPRVWARQARSCRTMRGARQSFSRERENGHRSMGF